MVNLNQKYFKHRVNRTNRDRSYEMPHTNEINARTDIVQVHSDLFLLFPSLSHAYTNFIIITKIFVCKAIKKKTPQNKKKYM